MSLVDYASSSDEDEPQPSVREEKETGSLKGKIAQIRQRFDSPASPKNDLPHTQNKNLVPPSSKQMEVGSNQSSELKLPDASLLLESPTFPSNLPKASDHSSRVAAAMAESAARKRDLKGSTSSYPRNKVPKGNLPHPKSVPDTADARLLPPQLAGRSNVVTEDISKLFVRKPTNSSA